MKYFELPFHQVENDEIHVKDLNNHVVFNWVGNLPSDLKNDILKKINGESIENLGNFTALSDLIYLGEKPILKVRGWGYLTGTLELDNRSACEIQNKLVNYVLAKLK